MVYGTSTETEVTVIPPLIPSILFRRPDRLYAVKPVGHDRTALNVPSVPTSSGSITPPLPASNNDNKVTFTLKNKARWSVTGVGAGTLALFGNSGPARAVRFWPGKGGSGSKGAGKADKDPKRILIMMSETGGGHKASAEAIKSAINELYGANKFEVTIVDMWKEHTPPPFNALPDSYSFLVKHSFLWRFTYGLTNPALFHIPYFKFVGAICRRHLHEAFDKYQPDLVVSVHPLMQHIPVEVMRQRISTGQMPPVNFATVVTDFTTCHNTWFDANTTRCFVPTAAAAELARQNGLKEEQIRLHGLPIRPVFTKALPPRTKLRSQLGMVPNLPAVLLVGGGEGMGQLEATVDELDKRLGKRCQVVVICGRNKSLLRRLSQRAAATTGMPISPVGFVNNIHEYMNACDLVVTKAGPGTIAEALICGLPILLNGNVPCQEEGNIPYIVDNRVGAFETDPPKIAAIIENWLGEGRAEFEAMKARSKALGQPQAVYRIARDLAALATEPDFTFGPARFAPKKLALTAA